MIFLKQSLQNQTFYIFRHGETYNTKNKIMYDEISVVEADILPEAKPIVRKMGQYLTNKQLDYCTSSPVKRCRQSVKIIEKEINIKFNFDERLTEYFGENVEHMVKRLQDFLEEIKQKNYSSVAICSHGEPVSALIKLLTKGGFTEDDLHNFPDTGIVAVVKAGKVEFKNFRKD